MPMPRAASTTDGSTARTPARVFRVTGSSAYRISPTTTGGLPNPTQMESSPNSAKLGTVRMVPVTARTTVAKRCDRAAASPSPTPATVATAMQMATIWRWVHTCGPSVSQLSARYRKKVRRRGYSVRVVRRCRASRRRAAGRHPTCGQTWCGGVPRATEALDAVAGGLARAAAVAGEGVQRPAVVGHLHGAVGGCDHGELTGHARAPRRGPAGRGRHRRPIGSAAGHRGARVVAALLGGEVVERESGATGEDSAQRGRAGADGVRPRAAA